MRVRGTEGSIRCRCQTHTGVKVGGRPFREFRDWNTELRPFIVETGSLIVPGMRSYYGVSGAGLCEGGRYTSSYEKAQQGCNS